MSGACRRGSEVADISRITIDPNRRRGQPCIRDLRITVYDVLEYLAAGMTEDEVLADFPELTHEDILACYAYAASGGRRTTIVRA